MSTETPYVDKFDDILKSMSDLHNKKGADYGGRNDPYANVRASQEFGIAPWIGALVRLNDKITRLKSFIRNGNLLNESVEDSIRDIQVYAVIMQILYEEQNGKLENDGRIRTIPMPNPATEEDPHESPAGGLPPSINQSNYTAPLEMVDQIHFGHALDWLHANGHFGTYMRLRRDVGIKEV